MPKRKATFRTPEELEAQAAVYFDSFAGSKDGKLPTIAGLAVHVNLSKAGLTSYARTPGYEEVYAFLKTRVEAGFEGCLGNGKAAQGAIFWLTNHAEYKIEKHINQTVTDVPATIEELERKLAEVRAKLARSAMHVVGGTDVGAGRTH